MYLDFFHLKEKPFNVTPDPNFLYMSPSHQEAFSNLLYGLRERKGFILVTGEVGTGKTTLLHNLLQNLDEDIQSVFVFHTGLDFTDLLEMIHHELNIPMEARTRASLMQSLNRYLIEQLELGQNVALIIDEAQNLSPEILENLRLLSNLETSKDKLLQIILVGQTELEEKMALPQLRQLRQRISVQSRILPLSHEESRAYVLHRLGVAGADSSGTPLFSEEALSLIFHQAQGIPRQLNVLCDNGLLIAYAEGDRLVKAEHLREVLRDRGQAPARGKGAHLSSRGYKALDSTAPTRRQRSLRLVAVLAGALALVALLYGSYNLGQRKVGDLALSGANPPTLLDSDIASPGTFPAEVSPANPLPSYPAALLDEVELRSSAVPAEASPSTPLPADQGITIPGVTVPEETGSPALETKQSLTVPASAPAPAASETIVLQREFWRASTRIEMERILDRCSRRAYTVKAGDHFIGLIFEHTGRRDAMVLDILENMNPHIAHYDHIEPGWVIYLPDFRSDHRE